MDTYQKFSAWAKLREALVNDPKRGTTDDSDAEFLRDFADKLEREGVSPSIKAIYKHQMEVRPELVPHMQKLIKAHQGKPAADPNSAAVTGMDPDTGQILDEPKHRAWMKKQKEEKAAAAANAPVDASQSSGVKIKKGLAAWVNKIMEHPTNSKMPPEKLVQSRQFQELLDSLGLSGPANAEMRKKATDLTISDLQNKQKQIADFARRDATSGSTATPPAAAPVAQPAPAASSGGGFGGWLKKKFGG